MADLQTFTARNRRSDYSGDEPFVPAPVTRFAGAELKAAPAPLPSTPPGPFGDLSRAPADEILRIVEGVTKGQPNPGRRRRSVQRVFSVLADMPGDSWQERWLASGFADMTFTPHDFRRLFATEIVNGGLPIHIGAALLGHLNLQTLQGYVAVFAEDVVANYQRFLNHRRSLRPEIEYTEVTPEEWANFEEHFDKRKVELGNCARPYGTPCNHEHVCIRCPMLQVSPKMLPRLAEIEKDLLLRRKRAQEEHWLGEVEGIDSTLTFLRPKQAEAARLVKRPVTDLGIPRPRSEEGQ